MRDQSAVMAPPRQELEELANKLQMVWECPEVDMRLKKRIVRTLIKEIIVDVDNNACEVIVVIHWNGGVHTEVRLPRRRRGQNSGQAPKQVIEALRELSHICSDKTIASILNRNGLVTGRGNRWTREHVTALRTYHQDGFGPPRKSTSGCAAGLGTIEKEDRSLIVLRPLRGCQ
jgi:hypothetical protein